MTNSEPKWARTDYCRFFDVDAVAICQTHAGRWVTDRGYCDESPEAAARSTPEPGLREAPDFFAADRALAVLHREDDQSCGCDGCMAYGAEDEGFDWYKVSPPRRIVLRVLDSGDDRLAPLVTALHEHDAALADRAEEQG